jgi:murein DD-endopeptidase MepM/ murein hydrolase activator NlpD
VQDAPEGTAARKDDKLVAERVLPTARQVIRAPFAQRVGDREVIRAKPFVRVASSLALTTTAVSAGIPPFNPLGLFAEGGPTVERAAALEPAEVPEGEISLIKLDLATVAVPAQGGALTDAEVIAQIQEDRANQAAAGRRAVLPIPPQLMLSRTLRAPGFRDADLQGGGLSGSSLPGSGLSVSGFPRAGLRDPAEFGVTGPLAYAPPTDTSFSSIEVRVVPENVTEKPKDRHADMREPPVEERLLMLRRGETLEAVLRGVGATPEQLRTIVAAFGGRPRVQALPEGQVLQATLLAPSRPGEPRQLVRVSLIADGRIDQIVASNDQGVFMPVQMERETPPQRTQRPGRRGREAEEDGELESEGNGPRLYDSLFETALRHEMPRPLIEEMVRIFAHDLDFQRRVSAGDSLEVLFTDEQEGEGVRTELLYASLSVGGETRRVFRFQAPDDGVIDYFDEEGRSLKKFLLRKPVAGDVEMRSGFGMRVHPILRYAKMHTGVDWANGRVGTPVIAAGHGTVIKAEWDSGYGRRVEIQHANGYVTTYSHLASFGRGVQEGARIRQGQVIGTIGNSGLSTGPHLHYEVLVNGNFVNPMKIRLPRGRELEGRILAEFKRQREAVSDVLARAGGARVAQRDVRSN